MKSDELLIFSEIALKLCHMTVTQWSHDNHMIAYFSCNVPGE